MRQGGSSTAAATTAGAFALVASEIGGHVAAEPEFSLYPRGDGDRSGGTTRTTRAAVLPERRSTLTGRTRRPFPWRLDGGRPAAPAPVGGRRGV